MRMGCLCGINRCKSILLSLSDLQLQSSDAESRCSSKDVSSGAPSKGAVEILPLSSISPEAEGRIAPDFLGDCPHRATLL